MLQKLRILRAGDMVVSKNPTNSKQLFLRLILNRFVNLFFSLANIMRLFGGQNGPMPSIAKSTFANLRTTRRAVSYEPHFYPL